MRVVLVDDYPEVRSCIRKELQLAGIEVVGEAADGEEALCLVERLHPDVLVLDVEMPKLNGVEVARHLRAKGKLRDNLLHILALSAHNNAGYLQGLLDAGATGYVLKDEALETIVQAVQTAARGQPWFSPSVLTRVRNRAVSPATV